MASAVCLHLMPSTRKMVMQIKTKQPSTYPTTMLSFLPKTTPITSTLWGQWTRIVQMPWRNLRGVQRMEYPSLSGWYVSSFYVCLQYIVYGTFTEKTMHKIEYLHACSTVYNCSKVGDHCSLGWHFKFCLCTYRMNTALEFWLHFIPNAAQLDGDWPQGCSVCALLQKNEGARYGNYGLYVTKWVRGSFKGPSPLENFPSPTILKSTLSLLSGIFFVWKPALMICL